MRHVHTVKRQKGHSAPRHVLCVDSALSLKAGEPGRSPHYFICGTVHTLTRDRDGPFTRVGPVLEHSPQHWLEWLYRRCRSGSSHWLIGRGIYQQLTAIGFFSQVDGDRWQMQAPPEGNGKHKRSRQWTGFVVFEEKTTIIVLRRAGGGVLHVCDVSNFGADLSDKWEADSEANVQTLSNWWGEWTAWIARTGAGSVKYTIGAQALACFKARHLHDAICVHTHEAALELEGKSLYGGRCEAYQLGRLPGTIYHLDARSLYGWCAANANIPVQLLDYRTGHDAWDALRFSGTAADVTVETEEPSVPYRSPDRGIIIWPVGTFRTTLCAPELSLIRECVRDVHAAAIYRMEPALKQFAEECWRLRVEEAVSGSETVGKQLKLFSQVLYGKFAQRYRGWRYSPGEEPPSPWSLWWELDKEKNAVQAWRSIAGRVEKHVDGGFTDGAIPIISAWISSLARVRLWGLMEIAGRRNVYYVDTDSLFVSQVGMDRLTEAGNLIGPNLGQLRVEGEYDDVEVHGWKHYYAGGQLKCSGFDRRARQGYASHAGPPKIEPVSEACRHKRPPAPIAQQAQATVGSQYRHGEVLAGGRVVPFRIAP